MKARNWIGLYGSYTFGMAGIGFTLPLLPLFLHERGLSEQTIGLVSTMSALAGLIQFPLGLLSDRVARRKPMVVVALALLLCSTWALRNAHGTLWLAVLVALFAENGACRASVESLSGALAIELAGAGGVGAALGALRAWKPIGIIVMALLGGWLAERSGIEAVLLPLALVQLLALGCSLAIDEPGQHGRGMRSEECPPARLRDATVWWFVLAMVLFHIANASAGVYLALFMKREFQARAQTLSYAFIISNIVWMIAVRPAGRLADRIGRRPLLRLAWSLMTLRLAALALARSTTDVLFIQILDGAAQALFVVVAASWLTDRLGREHAGRAQVMVGCALVFGSAIGPTLSGSLLDSLGYRGTFGMLAGVGLVATLLVAWLIPETLQRPTPSVETLTT